jgi:hypothetical protein
VPTAQRETGNRASAGKSIQNTTDGYTVTQHDLFTHNFTNSPEILMMNKLIRSLEVKCERLEHALRKSKNLLAAARRRAAKREAHCRDRGYLALGAAVEAAITHRWPTAQTRLFLDAVTQAYPVDDASRSLRGITESGWISSEAARTRRLRWGIVARGMLLRAQIPNTELAFVARSFLQQPQQGYALAAISDVGTEFLALAENIEFWLPPPPADKESLV